MWANTANISFLTDSSLDAKLAIKARYVYEGF
jgi:hypothetical protein